MPKWLRDLLAYWSPTASLIADMERLRWEVRGQDNIIENLVGLRTTDQTNFARLAASVEVIATRLVAVESGQVPEFVLTNLRQVRSQLQSLVPQEAGSLPPTASTSGGWLPPAPQASERDLWTDRVKAQDDGGHRFPSGATWEDGQPPVKFDPPY